MAATIIDGSEHHFVSIWEGNGKGQRVGNFIPFEDNGTISKSCMFDDGDTAYLSRTPSSNGNAKTFTFSCWFKPCNLGASKDLFGNAASSATPSIFYIMHYSDSTIYVQGNDSGSNLDLSIRTSTTFEDQSKWYHIVVRIDTTQSTDSDRSKIYVDGVEQSLQTTNYPALNAEFGTSQTSRPMVIGRYNYNNTRYLDGYLAEVNFADGQSYGPETFGVTDTTTGRWIPKSLSGITYGTNGFRLQFANTAGQTIGDDTSGNTNDFTVTNLDAADVSTNTPTNNLAIMSNYTTSYKQTLAQGNRQTTTTGSNQGYPVMSTLKMQTGKYYAEVRCASDGGGGTLAIGCYYYPELANFSSGNFYVGHSGSNGSGAGLWYVEGSYNDQLRFGTGSGFVATAESNFMNIDAGDVIGIAIDCDNNTITFYDDDGSNVGTTSILEHLKPVVFTALSNMSGISYIWNYGDNGTFGGNETAGGNTDANGEGNFYHSVPANHVMLKQDNLEAAENVTKGIPDFMQIKNRDAADRWCWKDTLRGLNEYGSSASGAPGSPVQFNSSITDGVRRTLKGGFQVEDSDYVNSQSESYVSFNWVANNGVSATDTSGDLSTELQANPTAGFSIAKFAVSGSGVKTWAHGLGAVPEFGHLWTYDTGAYGTTYHHKMSATPAQNYTLMSSSGAIASFTNGWGTSGPSSTLWSGTVGQLFSASYNYIFYSWVGIEGYSRFDTYVGNGSTDGTFVYTGFKPRTIWIKSTGAVSNYVFDTIRYPNNPNGENVVYDGNYSEASTGNESLLIMSNGFKLTTTSTGTNSNGTKYIYGAWAEHPFFGADGKSIATAYG